MFAAGTITFAQGAILQPGESAIAVKADAVPATEPDSAEEAEPIFSAGPAGFQWRLPDDVFSARIRGYTQIDDRTYLGEGSPSDAIVLRRLRPIVEGNAGDRIDYRLMLDFSNGTVSSEYNNGYVQDAYVNARIVPEFQVQIGKYRVPVGLERIQSDPNTVFIERAYPSQIVPNRDLGAELHGEIQEGRFSWEAGIFSGVADGASGDVDRDGPKDFAARIFTQPFRNTDREELRRLGFGLGGTWGIHAGPLRGYVSPGQKTIFQYYDAAKGSVEADGSVWRLSPQAYYYWRSLGVLAEYAVSSSEVRGGIAAGPPESARINNQAWQVAFSCVLTGEDNSFFNIVPMHPLGVESQGWGAWVIAARISGLELDPDIFPAFASESSARRATTYTLGLSWYVNRNFRFTVNYEDTVLASALRRNEQLFLARAQLLF